MGKIYNITKPTLFMGNMRLVLKWAVNLILIGLIFFLAFTAYNLYRDNFGDVQNLNIIYNSDSQNLTGVPNELSQFEPNMRFNHNNLTYFIESACSENKQSKMLEAFSEITMLTEIISFTESSNPDSADILVGCSKDSYQTEENTFVAGEGGPTKFLNLSFYPIILKGKILLYNEHECSQPITELHELLHVFGFEHLNKTSSIMYPYINCEQEIDNEIIDFLKRLYSIPPKAELYFENLSASKKGAYLNFNLEIRNEGLIDSENVTLVLSGDGFKIDSFDLENIELGAGKTFFVENQKLPSRNINNIKFTIISPTAEYHLGNNEVELSVA